MELTDILRIVVVAVFVAFLYLMIYRDFTFSYTSPMRRYRYERKGPGDKEFHTRGSGFFLNPTVNKVAQRPRWDGEPHRRVRDSKNDKIIYDSTFND